MDKEEQMNFAKQLLDTSKEPYVKVGKSTFIMFLNIIEEQQEKIQQQQKEIEELNQVIQSKNKEIKLMKNTNLVEEHDKALKVINAMAYECAKHRGWVPFISVEEQNETLQEIIDGFYKEVEDEN